jgi:hypothetical protein
MFGSSFRENMNLARTKFIGIFIVEKTGFSLENSVFLRIYIQKITGCATAELETAALLLF